MLMRIRGLLNQLFKAEPVKDHADVTHEMLVRSHAFKQQYRTWLDKSRHTELLKNLYTSFTLSKFDITGELPVLYYSDGRSRHVLIHYIDPIGKQALPFLQDYFRDRIMRIGYNLFLSDCQLIDRMGYTERVESHLLRPCSTTFPGGDKLEQLYGAIQVSFHTINSRPLYLRISAEELTDPEFNKPFAFDELVEILFV